MGPVAVGPLFAWARSETRRRVAALVLAGVLAGLAAGLTIAAVDGSRRTSTAYERMRTAQLATDAIFYPSQVGVHDADVTKLSEIPEVQAWAGFALTAGEVDGDLVEGSPMVAVGNGWFDTIERPVVLEGRMLDPTRQDEAVVTSPVRGDPNVKIGMTLTWRNLSPQQAEQFQFGMPPGFEWTQAEGPVTELTIVGIVRLPMDSVVTFAADGLLLTSPAWAEAHAKDSVFYFTNALVRLRDGGKDDNGAFESAIAQVYGRPDLPVKRLDEDIERVQASLDLERTALLLFAAAVAIAGLVILSQTLGRTARTGAESAPVLSAMGMPASSMVLGLMLPFALTIAAALVVAFVAAYVLSARFPIGLARQLDPSLGYQLDGPLLAVGLVATAVLLVLLCFVASWRAVRREVLRRSPPAKTRAVQITKLGFSVPSAVGLSLAVEQGRGRTSSVRPALFAAAVGVLGVVGATAVVRGIDDASRNKERVGAMWDAVLIPHEDATEEGARAQLNASDAVRDASVMSRFPTQVNGFDAPTYALEDVRGHVMFHVLEGRAPVVGEVAIAPKTARHLGVAIGDTIRVGPAQRPLLITGKALTMQTPHSAFDEGVWLSSEDFSAVLGDAGLGDGEYEQEVLVTLADGAVIDDLAASVADFDAERPAAVADVLNLAKVRRLPYALAGFLVLLAIGAIAHSLLSGSRRRAHELAVLRSFGLTPRQTAACVGWQATVIGAVAVVIGIPIGILAGRLVWRLVTDSLSIVYRPPWGGGMLLAIVPAVLVVLFLLAWWPARAAARLRTAEVLRSE